MLACEIISNLNPFTPIIIVTLIGVFCFLISECMSMHSKIIKMEKETRHWKLKFIEADCKLAKAETQLKSCENKLLNNNQSERQFNKLQVEQNVKPRSSGIKVNNSTLKALLNTGNNQEVV